jgi:hypothetical protein
METLFDQPLVTEPPLESVKFDGPAFDDLKDAARLTGQIARVWDVMKDGRWRTVEQIVSLTGDPANSVQAQLRHLRKPRFGSYLVERRRVTENGLWQYRVGGRGEGVPKHATCAHCPELEAEIDRLQRIISGMRS